MMLTAVKRTSVAIGQDLRRHVAALAFFALWAGVTIKTWWLSDAATIQAAAADYQVLTTWSVLFIAAVLGIRALRGG